MRFQKESAEIWDEIQPLLTLHWEEIAHFKDIALNPDKDFYMQTDANGKLRVYTVRDEGELIGYSVYFIKENPHYKQSLQAVQDVVFIRKDKRGQGREFIQWCDDQLKSEGVIVVYHHVKAAHNWGHMLEAQGYKLVDLIYAKGL